MKKKKGKLFSMQESKFFWYLHPIDVVCKLRTSLESLSRSRYIQTGQFIVHTEISQKIIIEFTAFMSHHIATEKGDSQKVNIREIREKNAPLKLHHFCQNEMTRKDLGSLNSLDYKKSMIEPNRLDRENLKFYEKKIPNWPIFLFPRTLFFFLQEKKHKIYGVANEQ